VPKRGQTAFAVGGGHRLYVVCGRVLGGWHRRRAELVAFDMAEVVQLADYVALSSCVVDKELWSLSVFFVLL